MPKPDSILRVLSGQYKGRSFASPASQLTHPMGAREKLALFNMLQPYLAGARVADLYAGSGALGIEALSRGAASVIFVEKSPKIANVLRQNLQKVLGNGAAGCSDNTYPTTSTAVADHVATDRGAPAHTAAVFIGSVRDFVQSQLETSTLKVADLAQDNPSSQPRAVGKYDLILADPPYDHLDQAELQLIPPLLRPDGILALSYPANLPDLELPGLQLLSRRTYAAASLCLYQAVRA